MLVEAAMSDAVDMTDASSPNSSHWVLPVKDSLVVLVKRHGLFNVWESEHGSCFALTPDVHVEYGLHQLASVHR